LRLEKIYDAIAEVEEYIVNARFEKKALEKEKTTLENIRRILLNFSELFDIMNEQEQLFLCVNKKAGLKLLFALKRGVTLHEKFQTKR
jgi:hypothetical protein